MFRISALLGFLAVGLGAFGAHALQAHLEALHMVEVWKTAVFYHLSHTVVMLLIASRPKAGCVAWSCFLAGIILFSGSLYALAYTGIHWLGIITPFGGLSLLAGWLILAIRGAAFQAG